MPTVEYKRTEQIKTIDKRKTITSVCVKCTVVCIDEFVEVCVVVCK